MRKTIYVVMAIVMLLACMTGCTAQQAAGPEEADVLENVMANGKLVVAFEIGNEPWGYTDSATGELTGFSIDLMTGFADSIGVTIEWKPLEFSEMIPAVQAGKVDIVASNISRTTARAATVLFTDAVCYSSCVALVMENSALTSVTQINDPAVTITAPAGNMYEEMAYEMFPDATISALASTSDAIAALKAGRADVYLTDTNQAYRLMKSDPTIIALPEFLATDTVAYALDLDMNSYTLRDAFNTYLKVIKISGGYNELYNKYFDSDWTPLMLEYGA